MYIVECWVKMKGKPINSLNFHHWHVLKKSKITSKCIMQKYELCIYYIYSQSQCKFGKVMFKLTSIFPPLSLSGSSTYSSFTLQEKSKWSERGLQVEHICTPLQQIHLLNSEKKSLSLNNFPPVTSSRAILYYPLGDWRIAQSQFPVR